MHAGPTELASADPAFTALRFTARLACAFGLRFVERSAVATSGEIIPNDTSPSDVAKATANTTFFRRNISKPAATDQTSVEGRHDATVALGRKWASRNQPESTLKRITLSSPGA